MFLIALGITFALIAFFCAGFWLAHHWHQKDRDRLELDCFYCHECILCKKDKDASYCRSDRKACIRCISQALAYEENKKQKKKPGYMGDVNGAGSDPSTV